MGLLSFREYARLKWYFKFSEGDISRITSAFAAISAAELRIKMVRPAATLGFNDVMTVHPTRAAYDHSGIEDTVVEKVSEERVVRRALQHLAREEQEELILAFVVDLLPTREGFGHWGNLADRTSAATQFYRKKKRRVSLEQYLSRLSRRANWKSTAQWEGDQATAISSDCYSRALLVARKYQRALVGIDDAAA